MFHVCLPPYPSLTFSTPCEKNAISLHPPTSVGAPYFQSPLIGIFMPTAASNNRMSEPAECKS